MKANADMEGLQSSAQLAERVKELQIQIDAKALERDGYKERIPGIVALHRGSDLAAAAEHRRIRELTEEIDALSRNRGVFEEFFRQARQREFEAQWARQCESRNNKAGRVHDCARELQRNLEHTVELIAKLREADEDFCNSVPSRPAGFDTFGLSRSIGRRVQIALYALSNGAIPSARGQSLDSAYQLKQSGRHDIESAAKDYTATALRAYDHLRA